MVRILWDLMADCSWWCWWWSMIVSAKVVTVPSSISHLSCSIRVECPRSTIHDPRRWMVDGGWWSLTTHNSECCSFTKHCFFSILTDVWWYDMMCGNVMLRLLRFCASGLIWFLILFSRPVGLSSIVYRCILFNRFWILFAKITKMMKCRCWQSCQL